MVFRHVSHETYYVFPQASSKEENFIIQLNQTQLEFAIDSMHSHDVVETYWRQEWVWCRNATKGYLTRDLALSTWTLKNHCGRLTGVFNLTVVLDDEGTLLQVTQCFFELLLHL